MATYLIDYENVKSEGIKGIAQLSEEDRVVIFYSHNADTITFEAMDMIFNFILRDILHSLYTFRPYLIH